MRPINYLLINGNVVCNVYKLNNILQNKYTEIPRKNINRYFSFSSVEG